MMIIMIHHSKKKLILPKGNEPTYLGMEGNLERAGASTILIFTGSFLVSESARITTATESRESIEQQTSGTVWSWIDNSDVYS